MAECKGCFHYKVCDGDVGFGYAECPHYISSADVVPKSEVERWKENFRILDAECSRLEKYESNFYDEVIKAKAEVAREIFAEIWSSIATRAFTSKSEDYADGAYDTIEWVDSKITEIEKKYVKGCRTCKHMLSCEPNVFGICEEYEEKET